MVKRNTTSARVNLHLITICMIGLLTAQSGLAQESSAAETVQPPTKKSQSPAVEPMKSPAPEQGAQKDNIPAESQSPTKPSEQTKAEKNVQALHPVKQTESEVVSAVDKRRRSDAAVDRNFVLPSAETMAQGELAFNSYQLFLAGVTYGLTDSAQLSLTTMLPIVADIPLVLLAGFKYQLIRNERFLFSIQPSVSFVNEDGSTGGNLGISFLLDFILDKEGKAVISIAQMNSFFWGGSSGDIEIMDESLLILLSAGFNYRVHNYVKLMFEFLVAGGLVNGDFEIVEEATLFNYGVRFCGQTISVDLSFLRPLDSEVSEDFVMGIPFVAFSARF